MLGQQTIRLPARTTSFTAICEACLEAQTPGAAAYLRATVEGSLGVDQEQGWATCLRGHRVRVVRTERTALDSSPY